jgi:hypothetical protein
VKRREFITLLGGAAAAAAVLSCLAARAQTPAIIGMMTMAAPTSIRQPLASFRKGLMQSGFVEGQNVKIEYRSAEGQFDRIPASGGKARHVLPGFSRERPTSTHAAWSCEPVTRIIVMEKLCAHW